MNCNICSSIASHIEKDSNIPYCSKSCQIIGNDIMNLPSEVIEKIIYKLDTDDILKLLISSIEFRRWFYSDLRYFQYFFIDKVIEYINEGSTIIFTGENCKLSYYFDNDDIDDYEKHLFSFNNIKIYNVLKKNGISGTVLNDDDEYEYHVLFNNLDFKKFLQILWENFKYKYESRIEPE